MLTILSRLSLKTKITVTTLAVFAFSLWSLLFFSDQLLHRKLERQIGEQQFSTVSTVAASLDSEFAVRFESLRNVASRMAPLLRNEKGVQAFLENRPVLQSMFNGGVIAFNRSAKAIAEVPLMDRIGLDYSDRDSVIRALKEGKSSVGRPVIGKRLNVPTFLMTVPIIDVGGNIVGALSGVVNLERSSFLDRISKSRYGKTGTYILASPQHRMLVTGTEKRFVMQPFIAPGVNPMFDRYAQGYEGSGRVVDSIGVEVLSASANIPAVGWFLVVRIPAAEAFAPLREVQKSMLVVTIVLTLFAFVVTWWVLRRQLSPLTDTAKALADFAEQDEHPEPLPVRRHDEIGRVIRGFNHLLEILGNRETELRLKEQKYRTMFQASLDPISISELDSGKYIEANDSFLGLLGYTHEEVIGHTSLELGIWDDRSVRDQLVEILKRQGMCRDTEVRFRKKNGDRLWASISVACVELEGVACVLFVFRDISERLRAEKELRETQAVLQAAMDNSPAGIAIANASDGSLRYVNDAGLLIRGGDRKTVVNGVGVDQYVASWRLFDLDGTPLKTDDVPLARAILYGETTTREFIIRTENNEDRIVLANAAPIRDDDGKVIAAIVVFLDITERKQVEAELERHKRHLEQLVEARTADLQVAHGRLREIELAMDRVGIGIQWVDHETGRLLHVNLAETKMLGYSVNEMLKLRVFDIDPNFDEEKFRQQSEAIRQQGMAAFESVHRTKDGRAVPVELTIYYQPGSESMAAHHVVFVMDITQRKEAEKTLVEAKESAEAANLAKSTFLSNMSHEIRTPLNGIIGMTHILRRGQVTPEQSERLGKIDTSAEHLLSVINDILDLSKIEAGKVVLDDGPVSIHGLTGNVKSIMSERARAKGLHLKVETDYYHYDLRGDQARLQQALLNYVGNAIKFTPTGVVTLRAIAQEESTDSVLMRFEVRDTGIGIAPEAIPRLFTPFEQAEKSTTRKYGGTGLGLTITRRLAELMDGQAGVESTLGMGSTFWFTARLARNQTASSPVQTVSSEAEMVILQKHKGRRILVVDDEPLNLEVAQFLLEEVGLVVDSAEDGVGALEKARENAYAVILMDMQMPNLDGLSASMQIRALSGHRETPIIALTANAFVEDRTRCIEAGMDDFLAKPFRSESLFTTVLKWMGRSEND